MSKAERLASAWVLLIAGWTAYGIGLMADSTIALLVSLVLFVGACAGFVRALAGR